jgi:hypothetical protein
MRHRSPRWPAFVALLALTAALQAADPPEKKPAPAENKSLDGKVFTTLRDVINRGADLYNNGDMAACYRLYEGSLMTIRSLIDHRPELQKAITAGLASAERDPLVWRRAFTLRNVMDKIRGEVNPNPKNVTKKLTVPPIESKEEKKAVEKEPAVKKPSKAEAEEKKTEEKKTEEKKTEEKKTEEKKAVEKQPDDILPAPKTEITKSGERKAVKRKGDKKDD